MARDIETYRDDFPQLKRKVHDQPLTYLDSAATSLKPSAVIERITEFYSREYGTVRRGVYLLSQEATAMFEGTREHAAEFLNAPKTEDIVFVRGVTEGMNLIANSLGDLLLEEGDEIVVSEMEHHANILPWQFVTKRTGAKLRVIPMDDNGELKLETLDEILGERTKIVSTLHVSNALGTVNPIATIGEKVREQTDAVYIVDGAQSAPHMKIDVQELGCDFFIASGHKMFGPTGAGLLYGKTEWLEKMPPFLGGGEMIERVTFEESTFEDPPHRFEAGTPAIGEVIGLGAALKYIDEVGIDRIHAWEQELLSYCTEQLSQFEEVQIMGRAPEKSGVVAFTMEGAHPFDIGTLLDHEGVAIRVGHHCAQPVMDHFGVAATARVSFGLYNNREDIDRFIEGMKTVRDMLLT